MNKGPRTNQTTPWRSTLDIGTSIINPRKGIVRRSYRAGHAGGRGGRAHHDDPVLIVIVRGDRGDGGVIDQGVRVVDARRIGVDISSDTATAQGGLSDDQHAARRLQHDHLPHPRRLVSPLVPSHRRQRTHSLSLSLLVLSSTIPATTLSASFSCTTRSTALKAPARPLPPAPSARTNTSRLILKLSF